jgi:hypothetical protein
MRILVAMLLLVAGTGTAVAAKIVFAGGNWAAIDFGNRCEARTKALWARPNTQPFAGFAFDRTGTRRGIFYAHLSRPARTGASVIASIGSAPFLLANKGQWAWVRSPQQQSAILEAARYGASLRVEFRDSSGRRTVDHYALGGGATAIDAAAAACAGKNSRA